MVLTVREVMTPQVVTIDYMQSVRNAARRMTKFGISSLLVVADDGLKGIITERDIVQRIVCSGLDPAGTPVCDVMSEPVIVVGPEEPLEKAVELMLIQKIKKLPVMERDDGVMKLIGILSLLDVAQLHPDLLEGLRAMVEEQYASAEGDFYVS